jgi:uncharacterized membrane protein
MALSCDNLEKLENEEERTPSDKSDSPVAFTLFVIVVIIILLWTFFPTLFFMVMVFLISLLVVYNTHAVQDVGKEECQVCSM